MGKDALLTKLDKIIGDDSGRFRSINWWADTGCDLLNWVIHPEGSGLPGGRVIEIYGKNASGKSALALHVCRWAQKNGGRVFYIDTEPGLSLEWAQKIGVDTESMWVDTPASLEQALAVIEAIVDARKAELEPTIIVLDSLAAVGCDAALERNTMKDATPIGDVARLMSGWLRNKGIPRLIRDTKICLLILNQTREKVGVLFGNPETTPGGQAVPFAAWLRLRVERKTEIKPSTGEPLGYFCEVKVVKSKVNKPNQKCSFPVYWKFGIDNAMALILYLQNEKVVPAEGSYITWNGQKVTKRKLRDQMLADKDLYNEVREMVRTHIRKEW